MADSNSIDGTITDVLKRLNETIDQSGNRKRKRTDSSDKATLNDAPAINSGANTSVSSGVPVSSPKSDALSELSLTDKIILYKHM